MMVKDAMTASVVTTSPEMSLKEAAGILAENAFGGLPVLDESRSVLGMLTDADILLKEGGEAPSGALSKLLHRDEVASLVSKIEAQTVGDAMSSPAITIGAGLPVNSAASLMLEHGVTRLPVVERDELVGIITRHDLVRAFARSDREIEEDIRETAFRGLSRTEELDLRVKDGAVRLRGKVDSRFDAEVLPNLIRKVPGVVSVDSELTAWDFESHSEVVVNLHRH